MAKIPVPILRPLTINQYTVKESFSFFKEISSFPCRSLYMTNFDLSSHLTKIPLDEFIKLCKNIIFDKSNSVHYKQCTFGLSNFQELLFRC